MFIRKSSPFRHFIVSFSQKVINFSATLVKTRHRFVVLADSEVHIGVIIFTRNLLESWGRFWMVLILDGVGVEGGLGFEIGV